MIDRSTLLRLLEDGASTRLIALKLDCSETTVLHYIHKFALPLPFRAPRASSKRLSPEQKAAEMVRRVSAHRKRLKARSIEYKGGRCQLCGYNKCNAALEFHHLKKDEKSFGLSRKGITRSWESIRRELDKCVLICANCHREVEAGVRTIGIEPPIKKI
jgi:hypothetical protein